MALDSQTWRHLQQLWNTQEPLERLGLVYSAINAELAAAQRRHAPMGSWHEGSAVLREEFEELWDEVKRNHHVDAAKESVQVAAMAIRCLLDLATTEPHPKVLIGSNELLMEPNHWYLRRDTVRAQCIRVDTEAEPALYAVCRSESGEELSYYRNGRRYFSAEHHEDIVKDLGVLPPYGP